MNALLKSAVIVDSTNSSLHLKKRDILIKNGKIEKIASKIDAEGATKVLGFENLHVSIGWFDTSVSFGEPGREERETLSNGLQTAAKSGFTDIVLNTNTNPAPDSSSDIIFFKERSKDFCCNLHPMGSLTHGGKGETMAELFDMHKAGAVAFSDHKQSLENPNLLKIALQYIQNFDGMVLSFPEDSQIAANGVMNEGEVSTLLGLKGNPNLAEELQLTRDLYLLEYSGGRLHIPTISTANSVKLVAEAKKKGLQVSCSVAIHNLILTDEKVGEFDSNYKLKPPLRTQKDANALVKGLQNGTIDFATSDHAPIDIEEKRLEFDNAEYGTIGLESAFGALNQLLGADQTVKILTNRANWVGVSNPELKEGETACLTLFNPDGESAFDKTNVHSTSKNSAFYGEKLKGTVYGTINNNKVVLN